MSELYRTVAQRGHGDRFLDLLAGAQVWCDRLDDMLARDCRCDDVVDSDAVDLMLGLIAVRTRLAVLFAASERAVDATAPAPTSEDSLLR